MKALLISISFVVGALLCQGVYADTPAAAAHTALCKDGTYFDGTTHKGACKGHQGVKEWLDKTAAAGGTTAAASDDTATTTKHKKKKADATDTAAAPATAAPAATSAAAPAATTAATGAAATTTTKEKHTAPTPASQITAKPGGGAGLVWVNSESKVYHCQGDEWYGKTKEGSYMSVADAEKAGAHASHGTPCK